MSPWRARALRIRSCLAYSPRAGSANADVRIASNPVRRATWMIRARAAAAGRIGPRSVRRAASRVRGIGRRELVEDGTPVESYRRIELDEALALLG